MYVAVVNMRDRGGSIFLFADESNKDIFLSSAG